MKVAVEVDTMKTFHEATKQGKGNIQRNIILPSPTSIRKYINMCAYLHIQSIE